MLCTLREETVEFLTTAPTVLVFTGYSRAAPAAVFAALTDDPSTWRRWFPGFIGGRYLTPAPHELGARRRIAVLTMGPLEETIVEFEPGSAWTYRVDSSQVPFARALLEQWSLAPRGTGTEVTWTFAIDPRLGFRLSLPVAVPTMRRMLRRTLSRLDRLIAPSLSLFLSLLHSSLLT